MERRRAGSRKERERERRTKHEKQNPEENSTLETECEATQGWDRYPQYRATGSPVGDNMEYRVDCWTENLRKVANALGTSLWPWRPGLNQPAMVPLFSRKEALALFVGNPSPVDT